MFRYYKLSSIRAAFLKKAPSLYAWIQPDHPEDLAFYSHNGDLWLGSIAHEADAWFGPTSVTMDDARQLMSLVASRELDEKDTRTAARTARALLEIHDVCPAYFPWVAALMVGGEERRPVDEDACLGEIATAHEKTAAFIDVLYAGQRFNGPIDVGVGAWGRRDLDAVRVDLDDALAV